MSKIMPFTMRVKEVFTCSTGVGIIIGEVNEASPNLTPCEVEVRVGNTFIKHLMLVSERMPGPTTPRNHRIFETKDSLDVNHETIQKGMCLLIHA